MTVPNVAHDPGLTSWVPTANQVSDLPRVSEVDIRRPSRQLRMETG